MSAGARRLYYRMPASRCPHVPRYRLARQCWLIAKSYSEKDNIVRSHCNSPRNCTRSKIRQPLQYVDARCRRRSPAASKISSLSGHAWSTCNKPWSACCMESRGREAGNYTSSVCHGLPAISQSSQPLQVKHHTQTLRQIVCEGSAPHEVLKLTLSLSIWEW